MESKVKGYKVFNPDWTCRGKQYSCPGNFEEDVTLSVCNSGMHFCKKASDCFNYYQFDPNNHVAEVVARGNVVEDGDKCATDKLEIIREIPWAELLEIVNTGKWCTGYGNSGNRNSGDCNSGYWNSGDYNSGDHNSGNRNSQFCRRSHAVCCGGGTDPGNVAGAALQRRHRVFCGGIQRDDGAGCGTGVTAGGLENEISFGVSENA